MTAQESLTVQCTALSKRTRRRCGQLVVGGGPNAVCQWHGGAAPQVERQRQARVAIHEARVLFQDRYEPREWGEALRAAGQVVDQVTRYWQDKIELAEYPSDADLEALVLAAEKSARMAKLVQDAGLDERRAQIDEATSLRLFEVLQAVLADLGHSLRDSDVQRVLAERFEPLSIPGGAS